MQNKEKEPRSWSNSKDEVISIWKQWRFLRTQKNSRVRLMICSFCPWEFLFYQGFYLSGYLFWRVGEGPHANSCYVLATWQSLLLWAPVTGPHGPCRSQTLATVCDIQSEFYYVRSKISLSWSFTPSVSLACSMCELGSLGFLWT